MRRSSLRFGALLVLAACLGVSARRSLEQTSSYPTCSFNNGVCAPTAAAGLSLPKPVTDLEWVLAKSAAYSFLCNQHTSQAACQADTANFCMYDARASPACDIDADKVPFLDTSKCPNPVDAPSKFGSSSPSCRLAFMALYSCYAYSVATCPASYCAKGAKPDDDPCAFNADKPSFVLVFDGSNATAAPFGVALRPVADRCAAAATAEACAAVDSITVDPAVAAAYRDFSFDSARAFYNLAGLQAVGVNITAVLNGPKNATGATGGTGSTATGTTVIGGTGGTGSSSTGASGSPSSSSSGGGSKDMAATGNSTTTRNAAASVAAKLAGAVAAVSAALLML